MVREFPSRRYSEVKRGLVAESDKHIQAAINALNASGGLPYMVELNDQLRAHTGTLIEAEITGHGASWNKIRFVKQFPFTDVRFKKGEIASAPLVAVSLTYDRGEPVWTSAGANYATYEALRLEALGSGEIRVYHRQVVENVDRDTSAEQYSLADWQNNPDLVPLSLDAAYRSHPSIHYQLPHSDQE